MPRLIMFTLFYIASFLQAGAYGLTFLLPRLFDRFGADEKTVGAMLFITAIATMVTVYFSGHLSDLFGRVTTLALACLSIAAALFAYGAASGTGGLLIFASVSLGAGWGITYALSPIVLTGLVATEERVRFFAILSVALMAGFGLSPVMAAVMEDSGLTVNDAFYVTAILCVIAAVLFFLITGAVRNYTLGAAGAARASLSLAGVMDIMRSPARLPVIMVCIGASVFAGMNNFQTVFADERGLDYADYFLTYTLTVVIFRVVLARFKGGANPWRMIALLQYVMCASVVLFMGIGSSFPLYLVMAFLFGIGYGVSYPILAAMAANDARPELLAQTLQFFALSYFIGIFGFPLLAGWMIVEMGSQALLMLVAAFAGIEATMALMRSLNAAIRGQKA